MRNHTLCRILVVLVVFLLAATAGTACAQRSVEHPDAATLRPMYAGGADWDSFLANAVRRRALWLDNWQESDSADDFVERARALTGNYRILAVATDACSDSANTIPYIARLAARVDGLALQIVDPDVGRSIMDVYRTPDDRGATPTVVILDENFAVVGTWVERPAELQDWWIGHPELSTRERARRKQDWYDSDQGHSTYAEIVALLEAADAGR